MFSEEVALWLVLSSNLRKHQTKILIVIVLLHVSLVQNSQFDAKSNQIGIPKYINCQFFGASVCDHLCYPNLTEAVSVDLTKENCNKMFAFDNFPVWEFPYSLFDIRYCAYCMLCARICKPQN